MQLKKWFAALTVGSALVASTASFAAEKKAAEKAGDAKPAVEKTTDKPAEVKEKAADAKPAAAASTGKVTKPWSDIASLTDEQKAKIEVIHKKALAETTVIDKKEKEDIMALLSDAQKAELKEATSKKKKDAAVKKSAEKTTTEKPEAK